MKKLSKILALSLALAMTFGMTALASESPESEGNNWEQKAKGTSGTAVVNGVEQTVGVQAIAPAKEDIDDVKAKISQTDSTLTTDVKKAAGFSKSAAPQLIFVLDIKPTETVSGSIQVKIPFTGIKAPAANEKYVLMHWNGSGWDVVSNVTVTDGSVIFTNDKFSNYALFLVKEDKTTTGGGSNGGDQTPAPASEPVSPKTGESVPAAGFAALILLAGAAVCAKKVQFNH